MTRWRHHWFRAVGLIFFTRLIDGDIRPQGGLEAGSEVYNCSERDLRIETDSNRGAHTFL